MLPPGGSGGDGLTDAACAPHRVPTAGLPTGPGISDVNKYVTTEVGSTEQFGLAMTIIYMFIKVSAAWQWFVVHHAATVCGSHPRELTRTRRHPLLRQLAMIALAYGHFTSLGGMQAASHPDQRELPRCCAPCYVTLGLV